jgi:hypothetical protein
VLLTKNRSILFSAVFSARSNGYDAAAAAFARPLGRGRARRPDGVHDLLAACSFRKFLGGQQAELRGERVFGVQLIQEKFSGLLHATSLLHDSEGA